MADGKADQKAWKQVDGLADLKGYWTVHWKAVKWATAKVLLRVRRSASRLESQWELKMAQLRVLQWV